MMLPLLLCGARAHAKVVAKREQLGGLCSRDNIWVYFLECSVKSLLFFRS